MLLNKKTTSNTLDLGNSASGNSEASVSATASAVAAMSLSDDSKNNVKKNNLFSKNFQEETLNAAMELDERSRLSSEGSFVAFPAANANAEKFAALSKSNEINTDTVNNDNTQNRNSFDTTNKKLGSLSHPNDFHKSPPFLSSFDFKQPFTTNADGLPKPPMTSSSLMFSLTNSNGFDGFDGGISPLTPQRHIFLEFNQSTINPTSNVDNNSNKNYLHVPPISQESLTSPLSFSQEYTHNVSPSRLSHHSSNSIGFLSNIDEITSDSINNMSSNSDSESKVRTKSVFDDIWNDNKNLFGEPPKTVPNDSTYSPHNVNASPQFRRFSYDATTAATFVPQSGDTINNFLNPSNWNGVNDKTFNNFNNINNMKLNNNISKQQNSNIEYNNLKPSDLIYPGNNNSNGYAFNNNNNNYNYNYDNYRLNENPNLYSRHVSLNGLDNPIGLSFGLNNNNTNGVNMNMNMNLSNSNGSNNFIMSNEQLIHFLTQTSTYLGFPTAESLDIEHYLSYLNNNNLPQLTIPSDLIPSNNYEIIACCFKNSRIDVFYIGKSDKEQFFPNLKIGDLVIVEADRGRDLGKVVKLNVPMLEARLLRYAQYLGRKAALSKDDDHKKPILNFPKPILRLAQNEELLTIDSKIDDEIRAIEVCQHKVREFGLNMAIVDAEYQWDMKKLTFYYNSEVRIDFRDLVKELFRIYKIRIWMSKKGGIC